ncbi:MAG: hypothetical protein A4E71_01383 [Smithella sp. PtaU1.Bin162]|nr:MAG: hypothetical protein A4E71_01383 [Smithella sp. PtaU1.Bin162]
MQNIKLYNALAVLTKKSLEIISKSIDKNFVVVNESTWVKQDNETYVRQGMQRPLWGIVLHKAKDEITKTEEFVEFSKITNSDQIISPQLNTLVGTCMGRSRFELFSIVFNSLSPFLTDTEIVNFDDQIFKTEYSKIEKALYSDKIELERLTPLCGFLTDSPNFVLDDKLSIVKLSDPEVLQMLRLGIKIGDTFGQEDFIHHIHQFAIKLTYDLPKIAGDGDIQGNIDAHIPYVNGTLEQKLLSALRLFKEGKIYALGTVVRSNSIFNVGVSYNLGTTSRAFIENKFQLSETERDKFIKFWEVYQGTNIPENNFLSVAIRRFSQANERVSTEDKIIDLFISAEALFLSSGGSFQGELKYRLSHRAAMFLDDEKDKQREVFKFMQKAYDVRSAIVHGTALNLPKKDDGMPYLLEEFCKRLESDLRVAINKTIKQASTAKNPNKVLEWDSIIFPSG